MTCQHSFAVFIRPWWIDRFIFYFHFHSISSLFVVLSETTPLSRRYVFAVSICIFGFYGERERNSSHHCEHFPTDLFSKNVFSTCSSSNTKNERNIITKDWVSNLCSSLTLCLQSLNKGLHYSVKKVGQDTEEGDRSFFSLLPSKAALGDWTGSLSPSPLFPPSSSLLSTDGETKSEKAEWERSGEHIYNRVWFPLIKPRTQRMKLTDWLDW